MMATQAEAHAEWHREALVPVGLPCPWDACGHDLTDEEGEALMAKQDAMRAAQAAWEESEEAQATCEHGMSAWLCAGPGHYPMDDGYDW